MVRLICFLLIFGLFLVFIGLNLNNNCDIYFGLNGFGFKEVPVSITALASFFLGMFFTVPIALVAKSKKQPKEPKQPKQKKEKPEKKKKSSGTYQDEISKEIGPYGID